MRRWSENVSAGNASSTQPDVNKRGDAVAYVSRQTNGIPGAPGTPQILVRGLPGGAPHIASVSTSGHPAAAAGAPTDLANPFDGRSDDPTKALVSGPSMSVIGDAVAFTSTAPNLVGGDTNGVSDVFVHDRRPGRTELVSVGRGGRPANGPSWGASFGYNERYVAFISRASNLVKGDHNGHADAFLRDLVSHRTYLVSRSRSCHGINGDVTDVAVTDGHYVAFSTAASNLVRHDTNRVSDVFVFGFAGGRCGRTTRVSTSSGGRQANGPSDHVAIGNYAKYIAFESTATNLVPHDTNGVQDVFWHLREGVCSWKPSLRGPKTLRVSVSHLTNHQANGPSYDPEISSAGRFVYFDSAASNLYFKDTDTRRDIYHRDIKTDYTPLITDGPTGGVEPSVSYHGTQVVYSGPTQRGVPVTLPRVGGASAASRVPAADTLLDVLHVSIDHESAPPPREFR